MQHSGQIVEQLKINCDLIIVLYMGNVNYSLRVMEQGG